MATSRRSAKNNELAYIYLILVPRAILLEREIPMRLPDVNLEIDFFLGSKGAIRRRTFVLRP